MDDNTEGALAAGEYDDEPELRVTLDVDLPWTDLSHFRQRIESELGNPKYTAGRFARRDHWLFGGEVFRFLWDDEDFIPLPRSAPPSKQLYPNVRRYVRVTPSVHGESEVWYELDEGIVDEGAAGYVFYIKATRYSRDRLKIMLFEYNQPPIYGPRLLKWLNANWGSGVLELGTTGDSLEGAEDSSVVEGSDPKPVLPRRATPEDWYSWFDWFYRQPREKVGGTLEDMAKLCGRSVSRVETMHALYGKMGKAERTPLVGLPFKHVAGRRKGKG